MSLESVEVKKVLFEILDLFSVGLSNLVMVLNPGHLIIGGGVIEIDGYDFDYLRERVYDNLLLEYRDLVISKAVHYNKAGVVGGIYLVDS